MKVSPTTRYNMTRMISDVRMQGNVSKIQSVSAIDKIDTSNNAMSSTSGELLKEAFYDKLERNEKNKKEEQADEKTSTQKNIKTTNLRHNINNKEDKTDKKNSLYKVSEKDTDTINFIKSMLEKFNKSIDTIKVIDLARSQNNYFNIKKVTDENSRFLTGIGIGTDKLGHFSINEDIFVEQIMKNPQKISTLLEPSTGIIRKLCDSFGGMLEY
ncbi:MAG: hypothetical protein HXL16_06690 [Peptostreptococcaceae bacterium]|nr:hypothetical protein [Peptostreptococcaceae bacterium]